MARLYLHVGGYKTGSTAIQAYLKANRTALTERGLVIPDAGTDSGGRHLLLMRALTGGEGSPKVAASPGAVAAELARSPDTDAVISCEGLEAHIAATLPYFRSLGRELRVILYVRNQPQRLNSGYVQDARMLRARHGFADAVFRAMIDLRLRYSSWLVRGDLEPGEIVFRPYSGRVRADAVGDFLATVGVDATGLPPTAATRTNVSLSAVGVAALRMLSRWAFDRDRGVSPRARNRIVELIEQADAALGLPPFQGFDAATFDHVVRNYHGDNQWFAQAVWGRSWRELFADDMRALDSPVELDIESGPSADLREARRLFRAAREVFAEAADPAEAKPDDLPDLGFLLKRKVERDRTAD